MKKHLKLIATALFAVPLLLVGTAAAVVNEDGTAPPANEHGVRTLNAPAEAAKPQQAPATTLKERMDKRKAELKVAALTNAQKTRLKTRCKASQGQLSSVKGRINGLETSRNQVYAAAVERLTKLSEKLKAGGTTTTELDAAIVTLQTKIVAFNASLTTYKEAVADLVDMDCVADPDGFNISLQAARAARTAASQEAQAVRAYITDTIKPLLATIRSQLGDTKPEGTE